MASGAVIYESILELTITEGWIAGVSLDTFEQEP